MKTVRVYRRKVICSEFEVTFKMYSVLLNKTLDIYIRAFSFEYVKNSTVRYAGDGVVL